MPVVILLALILVLSLVCLSLGIKGAKDNKRKDEDEKGRYPKM